MSRQYIVLRNADSLALLRQDLGRFETTLDAMGGLAERAGATALSESIRRKARRIVASMLDDDISDGEAQVFIGEYADLRQRVAQLTVNLSSFIDQELKDTAGEHPARPAGVGVADRRPGSRHDHSRVVFYVAGREAHPPN